LLEEAKLECRGACRTGRRQFKRAEHGQRLRPQGFFLRNPPCGYACPAHGACAAALRESLCWRDSALRFLARTLPFPAKRALIRASAVALSVT